MSNPLFALASAYRALFTVAGGYATTDLVKFAVVVDQARGRRVRFRVR